MAQPKSIGQTAILLVQRVMRAIDLPAIIGMVLIFLFVLWLVRDFAAAITS